MSVETTLAERGARYGDFAEHAEIAQGLKDVMWQTDGWSRLAADQRQALEVIQDKVARILNGDPDYVDNWHDIQGYAQLVEKRLATPKVDISQDLPPIERAPVHDWAKMRVRLTHTLHEADGCTMLSAAQRRIFATEDVMDSEVRDYILDKFAALDAECMEDTIRARAKHVQD